MALDRVTNVPRTTPLAYQWVPQRLAHSIGIGWTWWCFVGPYATGGVGRECTTRSERPFEAAYGPRSCYYRAEDHSTGLPMGATAASTFTRHRVDMSVLCRPLCDRRCGA